MENKLKCDMTRALNVKDIQLNFQWAIDKIPHHYHSIRVQETLQNAARVHQNLVAQQRDANSTNSLTAGARHLSQMYCADMVALMKQHSASVTSAMHETNIEKDAHNYLRKWAGKQRSSDEEFLQVGPIKNAIGAMDEIIPDTRLVENKVKLFRNMRQFEAVSGLIDVEGEDEAGLFESLKQHVERQKDFSVGAMGKMRPTLENRPAAWLAVKANCASALDDIEKQQMRGQKALEKVTKAALTVQTKM